MEYAEDRRHPYERRQYEILPGDVALGYSGDEFKVLLGSCISVILTDPKRSVATVCHVVHAGRSRTRPPTDAAWGDVAWAWMCAALERRGFNPRACVAYVSGGGNMFPHLQIEKPVGDRNIAWADGVLAEAGVPIAYRSVGGDGYRVLSWTVGPDHPEVQFVPAA